MYHNLEEIIKRATGEPWRYTDSSSEDESVKHQVDYTATHQSLYERRFFFQVSADDHKVRIRYKKLVDRTDRY